MQGRRIRATQATPSPSPHSRMDSRKKGRGLSASPLVGPTHTSDPSHTIQTTPHTGKEGAPYFFFRYKILYRPPLCFLGASGHNRSRGIAVYLLTVETRGKGGKTALCEYRLTAKTSAFQAGDVGSTPIIRSTRPYKQEERPSTISGHSERM